MSRIQPRHERCVNSCTPDSSVVQLVSQDRELMVISRDDAPPTTPWPEYAEIAELEDEDKAKVPICTPSEIQVLKSFKSHPWMLSGTFKRGSSSQAAEGAQPRAGGS